MTTLNETQIAELEKKLGIEIIELDGELYESEPFGGVQHHIGTATVIYNQNCGK